MGAPSLDLPRLAPWNGHGGEGEGGGASSRFAVFIPEQSWVRLAPPCARML